MKVNKVVQIFTETVEEEQFILNKFPEAWWVPTQVRGKTTFNLPIHKDYLVELAITEYNKLKEK